MAYSTPYDYNEDSIKQLVEEGVLEIEGEYKNRKYKIMR